MIRTLLTVVALATLPAAALAEEPLQPATSFGDVTVNPPSAKDTYVVRLDVTGKGVNQMRNMIWRASNQACDKVSKATEMVETYFPICVNDANADGVQQMYRILAQRKQGVQVSQLAIGAHIATR